MNTIDYMIGAHFINRVIFIVLAKYSNNKVIRLQIIIQEIRFRIQNYLMGRQDIKIGTCVYQCVNYLLLFQH